MSAQKLDYYNLHPVQKFRIVNDTTSYILLLDNLIKEPFPGFQPEALQFLKKLSSPKYNNKEWFDKHRDEYENFLKEPMRSLIDTLAIEISKTDKDIVVNYKSIFRINRDIRFSKIKTPYKNYYAAAFAFGKVKSSEVPQFYFHFSAEEFIVAGGQYSMDADYLKKIRAYIKRHFDEYKSIVRDRKFVKEFGDVEGISISKLPKGYENLKSLNPDDLLVKTLKRKQFYVWKKYSPKKILNEKMVDIIVHDIGMMYRFTQFLNEAVK